MTEACNLSVYHLVAVKMAEGLGYLNSSEQGYIRFDSSAGMVQAGVSGQTGAVTRLRYAGEAQAVNTVAGLRSTAGQEGTRPGAAAVNTAGQVKVVTCHKCRGQIRWRLELGSEGNCPHCGTLLHV